MRSLKPWRYAPDSVSNGLAHASQLNVRELPLRRRPRAARGPLGPARLAPRLPGRPVDEPRAGLVQLEPPRSRCVRALDRDARGPQPRDRAGIGMSEAVAAA